VHAQYPEEIAGLIHDVHALRTTMASDLSAAAAAVESDEPSVASDIIEGGRGDLAAFGQRPVAAERPVPPMPIPGRRRRAGSGVRTVLVATVPLLLTAAVGAAVVAHHTARHDAGGSSTIHRRTHVPGSTPVPPTARAAAMLHALGAEVRRGASPATIAARAALLHDELLRLIATAGGDRTLLAGIRRMLGTEERLLSRYADPRVIVQLRSVQRLEATLERPSLASALPSRMPTPVASTVRHTPAPTSTPTRRAAHPTHAPQAAPSPTTPPPTTGPPLPMPTVSPLLP
jgi:hypothetical protein